MTPKIIKEQQKVEKAQKASKISKKNMTAIKTTVAHKATKGGRKPKKDEGVAETARDCAATVAQGTVALGDVIERIYAGVEARKLSINSKHSAVSMANSYFKRWGRLPTLEEIEKDLPNAKAKGNARWLLKLVGA
jgi:hypothetical protein